MPSSLASIKSTQRDTFVYTAPMTAYDATRILVLVDMGHPAAQVSTAVLGKVLRGLRRADPQGRILITSSTYVEASVRDIFTQGGVLDLMDDNMRAADTDELLMTDYDNRLATPVQFSMMTAPEYIRDYECCISVSVFNPEQPAALRNLHSALLRDRGYPSSNDILPDIYHSIGHYFDGAVVEAGEQIIWGDDLLAVDEAAYRLMGVPAPHVLKMIQQQGG